MGIKEDSSERATPTRALKQDVWGGARAIVAVSVRPFDVDDGAIIAYVSLRHMTFAWKLPPPVLGQCTLTRQVFGPLALDETTLQATFPST